MSRKIGITACSNPMRPSFSADLARLCQTLRGLDFAPVLSSCLYDNGSGFAGVVCILSRCLPGSIISQNKLFVWDPVQGNGEGVAKRVAAGIHPDRVVRLNIIAVHDGLEIGLWGGRRKAIVGIMARRRAMHIAVGERVVDVVRLRGLKPRAGHK